MRSGQGRIISGFDGREQVVPEKSAGTEPDLPGKHRSAPGAHFAIKKGLPLLGRVVQGQEAHHQQDQDVSQIPSGSFQPSEIYLFHVPATAGKPPNRACETSNRDRKAPEPERVRHPFLQNFWCGGCRILCSA
jgi:hypothetical protein